MHLIKKGFYWLILLSICLSIFSEAALVHAQPKGFFPPKITAPNELTLIIDVHRCKMLVFQGTQVIRTFTVAVGTPDTPSPIGTWKITRKEKDWGSGFGARFMGLDVTWGQYGIHGTNKPWSIGSRASHGCIRMMNNDVCELYDLVQVGSPVIITGNPFIYLNKREMIHQGHKGARVVLVQQALKRLGYYEGNCDGVFGYSTERALKALQKNHKLEITGQVGPKECSLLGL